MTTSPPKINADGFYELRDAAKALGVHKATLSRWAKEGLIKTSIRRSNNRRVFLGKELMRFWRMLI